MSIGRISLIPQTVDLALYAGDGVSLRLVVTQPDDGGPLPLTGTVQAQIRGKRTDPDYIAEWAVDMTDAAQGVVVLSLSGEETGTLMNQDGVRHVREEGRMITRFTGAWDVQWTPDGSEPATLLQGAITCDLDVTRAYNA